MTALQRLLWVTVVLLCAATPAHAAGPRAALVIGNSGYQHVASLPNPANDARGMAAALQRLGFSVTSYSDLSFDDLRRALRDFGAEAAGADMAIVFYAGHGIEIGGVNYLVPVDARLATDRDAQYEAIPLDLVVSSVEGARSLKLVILDACRDNPFAATMQATSSSRSVGRGLARVEPATGTLVAFAAKEGTTAADGTGSNSPFTGALLRHIESPGLEISFLFRKVRDDVLAATGNRQVPFTYGSLPGTELYLAARADSVPDGQRSEATGEQAVTSPARDAAREAYEAIGNDASPAVLEAFARHFPDSVYAAFARARLDELRTKSEAVAQEAAARRAAEEKAARQAAEQARKQQQQVANREIEPSEQQASPRGGWFVVLGSFPRQERRKADERVNWLRGQGIAAKRIDTNQYGGLRNNLWAVVLGPFSRTEALRLQDRARRVVGDAYIKEAD